MSIPDCPDLDSLLQMDMERNRRRSGNSNQTKSIQQSQVMSPSAMTTSSAPSPASSSTNLLMQQLNSAPMNAQSSQQQPRVPPNSSYAGTVYNNVNMAPRPPPPPNNMMTMRAGLPPQHRIVNQHASPQGQFPMQQQQQRPSLLQQTIQASYGTPQQQPSLPYMNRPSIRTPSSSTPLHVPPASQQQRQIPSGDESRSLLQQLLSE